LTLQLVVHREPCLVSLLGCMFFVGSGDREPYPIVTPTAPDGGCDRFQGFSLLGCFTFPLFSNRFFFFERFENSAATVFRSYCSTELHT
jgi:hypothetical protein